MIAARRHGQRAELGRRRGTRVGRGPLIEALLAMGTGTSVRAIPAAGLEAPGYAVAARVQRLMEPPTRASQPRFALALSGLLMVLPAVSGLIFVLASGS